MAPFGVKVLCIEPGFFKTSVTDTALVQNNLKKLWDRLPQDVRDDYGRVYLEKTLEGVDQRFNQLTDSDLMKVVGCMEHAITAVHPRYRYSPGWDAKFFWLPMSYLPTFITDAFFLSNTPKPIKSVL
ncbi:Retinol dehydrogenase 2 [Oryzias melastigma]|nr:Retinol dehydrogenase 2 [Oryzias melastigma]